MCCKRISLVFFVLLSLTVASVGHALPDGFVKQRMFAGQNVNGPQKIDFGQDGSIFLIGAGQLQYFRDENANGKIIYDLNGRAARHTVSGMAVHPDYPTTPFVYLLWNKSWGKHGAVLSRLEINPSTGDVIPNSETTLLDKWCVADWDAHAYGDIQFGTDGFMYITFADGTRLQGTEDDGDWDDRGLSPGIPCGDPINEGGGYRSQDHLTPGDELLLNGTLLRVDPITGEAAPGNWNIGRGVPEDDRVIAWGLRNPYRFTIAPWGQFFISDVGWNEVEEVNTLGDVLAEPVNFGWPCYEGDENLTTVINNTTYGSRTNYYKDKDYCHQHFYNQVAMANPWFQWFHDEPNGPNSNPNCGGDGCNEWAATGIDVAPFAFGGSKYHNALFLADYSQNWIRVFLPQNNRPNKDHIEIFDDQARRVTSLVFSPKGELWYTDIGSNHVYRIFNPDQDAIQTQASYDASTTKGASPLAINLDASGSSGTGLSFAWDLDGDGQFNDGNAITAQTTIHTPGLHTITLAVTDQEGSTYYKSKVIQVADAADGVDVNIVQPDPAMNWAADDIITLQGSAVLAGSLQPAPNLRWDAGIDHCDRTDPNDCHAHPLGSDIANPSSTQTTLIAPQHEMPTSIGLSLCADSLPFAANWWNTDWNKRRFIFINNADNAQSIPAGAIRVSLDGSKIDYTRAGNGGNSLRFTDATGQVLQYEISQWNTQGESTVWVNIPATPASSVNHYMVMYYDNDGVGSAQTSGLATQNAPSPLLDFSSDDMAEAVTYCQYINEIHPQTTTVRVRSNPANIPALGLDSDAFDQTDVTHEVIINSPTSIFATPALLVNGQQAQFRCWQQEMLSNGDISDFDCNNDIQNIIPVEPLSFIADFDVSAAPQGNFGQLFLRGSFNQWGTLAMTLVRDNVWSVSLSLEANTNMKFDVFGDWSQNYGDDNPGDDIADFDGDNIVVIQAGDYVIEFNDETLTYAILTNNNAPQHQFDTMFIRGTLNGGDNCGNWEAVPMALSADFTWSTTVNFGANCAIHEFKFDASGSWTGGLNWGDDNADGLADAGGDNIQVNQAGQEFTVTFNTQTLAYSVSPTTAENNTPPIVNAGTDINVTTAEQNIVLTGTASDSDGTITTIAWTQESGPQTIFLTNADQLSASYPTPIPGTYVFQLTVTDNDGLNSSDTVTVTVTQAPMQSTFETMFIRGTMEGNGGCGGWDALPMTLVEDFVWERTITFDNNCGQHEFKFDATGNWSGGLNWGDDNNDGFGDAGGNNIVVNPNHNTFRVLFNDQTRQYIITEL